MCVKNKIKNRLRITPTFRIHCDGVGNAAVAVCTRRTHRARRNILASLRVTPVVVGGVVGGGSGPAGPAWQQDDGGKETGR